MLNSLDKEFQSEFQYLKLVKRTKGNDEWKIMEGMRIMFHQTHTISKDT